MTKEEVKDYIKNNLRFILIKHFVDCNYVKLTLTLYIENEEIQEEYIYITEGEGCK